MKKAAGCIDIADYPEWATPEKTSAWVRELRQTDELLRPTADGVQTE
ncbi:MAG: hypothetical protein Q7O66_06910 [Dehalococcoidia bacterium]|nr:hypothetical protein [Dehalococcoidia bacterium]